MPLVRDSPVAGTPNWASIYSATALARPYQFLLRQLREAHVRDT